MELRAVEAQEGVLRQKMVEKALWPWCQAQALKEEAVVVAGALVVLKEGYLMRCQNWRLQQALKEEEEEEEEEEAHWWVIEAAAAEVVAAVEVVLGVW